MGSTSPAVPGGVVYIARLTGRWCGYLGWDYGVVNNILTWNDQMNDALYGITMEQLPLLSYYPVPFLLSLMVIIARRDLP